MNNIENARPEKETGEHGAPSRFRPSESMARPARGDKAIRAAADYLFTVAAEIFRPSAILRATARA